MDRETITYNALIQELSVHELIVSHCHTKIGKFLSQFTVSRQPASTAQSLNESNLAYLDCAIVTGTSNVCVVACVQPDNVKTYSQIPFHLQLN